MQFRSTTESWAEFTATRQESGTHPASGADQEFPVERTIVKDTDDAYTVNLTSCEFADYFRRIGDKEIGALITCGVDFAVERRMRPGWVFSRSQKLMQGASHCDL